MELRTFKHLKPLPSHHDDSSFRKNKHCFALSLSQKGLWHTLWSSATCPAWKCGICHRHLHGEKASDVASWRHARWTKSLTSWSMNCQWMGNHTELQHVPRTRCDEGWGTFHPFRQQQVLLYHMDPGSIWCLGQNSHGSVTNARENGDEIRALSAFDWWGTRLGIRIESERGLYRAP